MANPPKPSANHTPAATARPPAAPTHADAPPTHKGVEIDVGSLTLSYTVSTSIQRLVAGRHEVEAWTHNLEQSLQTDVDAGALTEAEGVAVAHKYEVKKPTPKAEAA